MIVHVYAHCWNEELMLPHFFKHYDSIADQYFIFDTGSTDRSLEILESHPRVQLTVVREEVASYIEANLARHNSHWKQSRGQADWVIVTDIDEYLYHEDLKDYLKRCRDAGVTIIVPEGYEMISDEFPDEDQPLTSCVRYGTRLESMDKHQVFNPVRIEEINYLPGRHEANPTGEVVFAIPKEVKLLHYKHLGLSYTLARYRQLRTGLRARDIESKWGIQYLWEEEEILANFDYISNNAGLVINQDVRLLASRLAAKEEEAASLGAQLQAIEGTVQSLSTQLGETKRQAEESSRQMKHNIQSLSVELVESRQRIAQFSRQIEDMTSSLSWQIGKLVFAISRVIPNRVRSVLANWLRRRLMERVSAPPRL
jgi:hypothetical protein